MMGFVSDAITWPHPEAAMMMLGNTWPLNAIAQLVTPLLSAMYQDGWLGTNSWPTSSHAAMLLADVLAASAPP